MKYPLNLAIVAIALASVTAYADNQSVSKINGSIRIEANQTAGDLETVNGSIHLADAVHAGKVSTVNGSLSVGNNVTVKSLGTVNGAIDIGKATHIDSTVETVNGRITLRSGADAGGTLTTVNGDIRLEAAHAAGGIKTVGGDILVGADSRVEGGILMEKPSTGWFNRYARNPRVEIGPRAVVGGDLIFHRDVDLYVSDSAKIGKVEGATPKMFSGDHPAE